MDSQGYVLEFLKALGLTLALEVPVLVLLIRKEFKIPSLKIPSAKLLFIGLIASTSTIPYLWFVLPHFIQDYNLYLLVGEVSVTLLEAVLYYCFLNLNVKRALSLSLLCNGISFLFGLLFH